MFLGSDCSITQIKDEKTSSLINEAVRATCERENSCYPYTILNRFNKISYYYKMIEPGVNGMGDKGLASFIISLALR